MSLWPTKFDPDACSDPTRAAQPEPALAVHQNGDVPLRDGDLWVAPADLAGARNPRNLRCVSGYVWLTQEGCADDVVIGPGGVCALAGTGKVIVQALEDAVVRLERSSFD